MTSLKVSSWAGTKSQSSWLTQLMTVLLGLPQMMEEALAEWPSIYNLSLVSLCIIPWLNKVALLFLCWGFCRKCSLFVLIALQIQYLKKSKLFEMDQIAMNLICMLSNSHISFFFSFRLKEKWKWPKFCKISFSFDQWWKNGSTFLCLNCHTTAHDSTLIPSSFLPQRQYKKPENSEAARPYLPGSFL